MAEPVIHGVPALHELEMLSPWFDASAPTEAGTQHPQLLACTRRRLLLLLSAPRNGSYHLCRLLWRLGYGKPAEYFNPHLRSGWNRYQPAESNHLISRLQRKLRRQFHPQRPDSSWLRQLVRERTACSTLTGEAFFAAKLQPQQLGSTPAALRKTFAPLARDQFWAPFDAIPPVLVLLYRRDWQAALLSHHLALCSGSFDQGRIFTFQLRPLAALGTRAALLSDLAGYRAMLNALAKTLHASPYPIRVIALEDLLTHQQTTLAQLIQWIGPTDQLPSDLEQHPALGTRIQRATNPWATQNSAWKVYLHQRFVEEDLRLHPHAQDCAAAITLFNQASSR